MKKGWHALRRKAPYIMLLLGIWIIVIMFIAGGIYTNEEVFYPKDPSKVYNFTVFQALFGKSLVYDGVSKTFFKFNPIGILILPLIVVGLILPTFNRIYYRIRHLLSGSFLLVAGALIYMLPATARIGQGFEDPLNVTVTSGAPLIIAGIFTFLFGLINIIIAIVREKN